MTIPAEATENADRFYTMVKSFNNFDNREVKGVITTLLSKTDEENCFVGTYLRATSHIDTVLLLQNPKHFQAAAILARALFELAVDIRLLEVIPDATMKMSVFSDVEKLRSARKAVAFKRANPDAEADVTSHQFLIQSRESAIDARQRILWPQNKKPQHWSGLKLSERVKLIKAPFEQIYALEYSRLSWYAHPGLTGIINLPPEAFTYTCSYAFKLAVDSYWEVLMTVIRKFKIAKANDKIERQMEVAIMLPFTDNPQHVQVLLNSIQ